MCIPTRERRAWSRTASSARSEHQWRFAGASWMRALPQLDEEPELLIERDGLAPEPGRDVGREIRRQSAEELLVRFGSARAAGVPRSLRR